MSKDTNRSHTPLLLIVLISLCVQVAAIGLLHQYRFRTTDGNFAFGWEMGRIGRSIALGQGFSNPYSEFTGPTAWEPPLYPYLIGFTFKLFGIYSTASAWVLLTINSIFAALTCIPVFHIARRSFGEKVARWSAWTWALFPYIIYWSIHWVWDVTITPLLLSLVVLLAMQLAENASAKRWAAFGLCWGIIMLSNPSALSFLPLCVLWIWWQRRGQLKKAVAGAALAGVVMILCITPWLIRNHRTFGRFVFIRNDFGLQLRLGNGPSADGVLMAYLQPNLNVYEMEQFKRLGEIAYAERCKQIAFKFIRENPGRFAAISVKRFVYFWGGVPKPNEGPLLTAARNSLFLASSILGIWGLILAVRKRRPGAGLFAALFLSYPTTYYFVFPHARYRHVIEPVLLVLALFLISEAKESGEQRAEATTARSGA